MTKEEILKRVKKFQGANREFSQELPPIIEGLVDLIDEAGPEVVNNLTSNSPTKALSANMGKELKLMVDGKVSEPETAGTAGQILQLDEEGVPEWVDAAEVGATYDSTVSDTSTNAIQNKTIKKYVDDNFAQKDGYYGSLTAGAAENLVGRGSVPAEIAFRTSGGDQDLGTGSALITKILGRTEAWNQLVQNGNFADYSNWTGTSYVTLSVADNIATVSCTQSGDRYFNQDIPMVIGHKYLFMGSSKKNNIGSAVFYIFYGGSDNYILLNNSSADAWERKIAFFTCQANQYNCVRLQCPAAGQENQYKDIILIDLTLLYGAGNEPSTVAEFEALHPLPYYNYNAGVLKNNAATGLETVGFNQWDEEAEEGAYSGGTGGKDPTTGWLRSTNKIKVKGGITYYFLMPSASTGGYVYCYDAAGNYLGESTRIYFTASGTFTTPSDAGYITFAVNNATTYNHDICINLSWSGYRNGEYEPYEKHTLNLGLNSIPCHDENNNAVVVNGLDGVGTSYDEAVVENGMVTKIIKRFDEVDLGDLDWSYSATYLSFYVLVSKLPAGFNKALLNTKAINSKFATLASSSIDPLAIPDKTLQPYNGYLTQYLLVHDSAYSDASTFKTAMAGVKLRYELATPITLTVDEPFAASYYVNDFGTEARLPQDTADDPQAPFCADVQYAMNATDAIRNLPRNYVSINPNASDDSSLKALSAAISTALGIAVTWTWSESDREYTFSVADNRAFKLVSVPASASASGTAGNIAIDSSYLYICVATDTWKRVAIATWE